MVFALCEPVSVVALCYVLLLTLVVYSVLCFLYLSKSVGITSRQNKKVEEEEKLLKLFQGVNKAQDGFTQWCEQMLHALNTANNLDGKRWGGMRALRCGKTISGFFELMFWVRWWLQSK